MQKLKRQWGMGIALAGLCLLSFGASAFAQADTMAGKTVVTDTVITGTVITGTVITGALATSTRPSEPGILIIAVEPGSPAASAGFARGDILLKVSGKPVNDGQALLAVMAATKPGDKATVTLQHGDALRELTVTLAERQGRSFLGIVPLMTGSVKSTITLARPRLPGLPEMPDTALGATPTGQVQVIEVIKDSPADKAGLQAGDAIIALNGQPLAPQLSLAGQIQALAPNAVITLEIQPGDQGPTVERKVILGKQPDDPARAFLGVKVAPGQIIVFRKKQIDGAQGGYFKQAVPAPYLGWWMPVPLYGMPPLPMAPYGYWFGQPGFEIHDSEGNQEFNEELLAPLTPAEPTGNQLFFYATPGEPAQPPVAEPQQLELPDDPAL